LSKPADMVSGYITGYLGKDNQGVVLDLVDRGEVHKLRHRAMGSSESSPIATEGLAEWREPRN
jgi:hypothetical protein